MRQTCVALSVHGSPAPLLRSFQLSVKQAVFEKKASVAPREKKKLTKEDRAAKVPFLACFLERWDGSSPLVSQMLFLKQQAALSWADDGQEDDTLQLKIVVLKNVFDPSEFTGELLHDSMVCVVRSFIFHLMPGIVGEEAKEDIVELEHDVQAECSKLGDVDNVRASISLVLPAARRLTCPYCTCPGQGVCAPC